MQQKPHLSFWQILNMNFGFFGIQYSFGLQQANMSPIYSYLGADESKLPLLWLAGPMTGLLVQPIIGAMSDRTSSRYGRRTPYFLIGAILCSLSLLAMPYSPVLWMAASILWILDAANNVTMEPYRAYVSDRLNEDQRSKGFLVQSAFTGLAQTFAYLTPSLLIWSGLVAKNAVSSNNIPHMVYVAFIIGAVLSTFTVWWSLKKVPEIVLPESERAALAKKPSGVGAVLSEIWQATKEMPTTMRQLALVYLFQWYGLICYWQYITHSIARSVFNTTEANSPGFLEAGLLNGQVGAWYNFLAFLFALAMIPLARKFGAKWLHIIALLAGGLAFLWIPSITSKGMLFVAIIGMGICWGSAMGNPYILLAGSIPPERTGVYMGIFNMLIVIPMLIQGVTLPLFYDSLLGGDARNVVRFAGVLLICAAVAMLAVKPHQSQPVGGAR